MEIPPNGSISFENLLELESIGLLQDVAANEIFFDCEPDALLLQGSEGILLEQAVRIPMIPLTRIGHELANVPELKFDVKYLDAINDRLIKDSIKTARGVWDNTSFKVNSKKNLEAN